MERIIQLVDLFDRYQAIPVEEVESVLAKEIDSFLTPEIPQIFIAPKKYSNGDLLKEAYIRLLELFYVISCETASFDTRDKVFKVLYELYEISPGIIYSHHLQYAFCRHISSLGSSRKDEAISQQLFTVIEYSFYENLKKVSKIKSASEGKENEALITSVQRTSKIIILFGNRERKPDEKKISYARKVLRALVVESQYGACAAQLFSNVYARLRHTISQGIVDDYLSDDKKAEFREALISSENLAGILNYLTEHSYPYELGCAFMLSEENPLELYKVVKTPSDVMDPRFGLYALKLLSKIRSSEEDLVFLIVCYEKNENSLLRMLTSSDPETIEREFDRLSEIKRESKKIPLLTYEQREELVERAEALLEGELYTERKNPFSNSIDAEIFMIALVLKSSKFADVDLVASLKAMPEVISFNTKSSEELRVISSDDNRQESVLLQDVALRKKYDAKENLRRFSDVILSFIALKSDEAQ